MNVRDKQLVEHILRYCDEITGAIQRYDNSMEKFLSDYLFYNSCCMSLFQIGELSKRLSDDFHQLNPTLPWKEMRSIRNVFAHEYESVDKESLWKTIQNDIPKLRDQFKEIMQSDDCDASNEGGSEKCPNA